MTIIVKTLEDRSVALTRSMLAEFQAHWQGELLTPGETGYDRSRTIWNGMIDRRRGLIVRCLGSADVAAAVSFAR